MPMEGKDIHKGQGLNDTSLPPRGGGGSLSLPLKGGGRAFIYRLYQLLIAAPLLILATAATAIVTIIGCTLGGARTWGYYPAMVWSRLMCRLMLLPVRVEGQEKLRRSQSYVFVANHQGPYDVFLIYGFLGRSFRWMMKKELRSIPLVGKACESAGHIFVDKSGPKAIHRTYEQGRKVLRDGVSLVVFPEGARTFTGHMAKFRRGAFQLADELRLPVVPITINGSYHVLSRRRGPVNFVFWHRLSMTLHAPIPPIGKGPENIKHAMELSREAIASALDKEPEA